MKEKRKIYVIGKCKVDKVRQFVHGCASTILNINLDANYNSPFTELASNLPFLNQADLFLVLPGWDNFSDCRIEYSIAKKRSRPILML